MIGQRGLSSTIAYRTRPQLRLDRMQKHAVRGIPDTMRRRFKVGEDMQDEIVAFHGWFKHKMRIKHPGVPAVTDGKMTDEGAIDEVFVTMSWRPIRTNALRGMRPNDVRSMMGYAKADLDYVDFGQWPQHKGDVNP